MEELNSTVIRIIIYQMTISKSPPSFYRNATWLERTINIILTSTLEAIWPHISDHLAVKQRAFLMPWKHFSHGKFHKYILMYCLTYKF